MTFLYRIYNRNVWIFLSRSACQATHTSTLPPHCVQARPRSVSPGSNSAKVQWAWTSMDVPAASGLLRSGEDAPVGRRAHAGAVMEVDGVHYLYVHGGRAQSKLVGCLGDVWRVALGQEGAAWEREWAGDEDGHQVRDTVRPRVREPAESAPSLG